MSGTARRLAEAANEIMNPQPVAEAFKTGKTTSEFNGNKRGFNRFVEEQDVEEIEEEEEIEEGVRMMSGAEKMVKDSGGSVSSLRKIKKTLENKPTGSMIVVTKEKSPESVSIDIYEPSVFASLVKGLSSLGGSKPEAKVGSKGSWSGGEVTVVAIKEEVELQNDKQEAIDVGLQNSLNIARKTVKMNDVFVKVMGGMNRQQAWELLLKHGTQKEKNAAKAWLSSHTKKEEVEVDETWKSLKKTKADLNAIRASGKKVSVIHGEGDTLYRVSKPKKSK